MIYDSEALAAIHDRLEAAVRRAEGKRWPDARAAAVRAVEQAVSELVWSGVFEWEITTALTPLPDRKGLSVGVWIGVGEKMKALADFSLPMSREGAY